MMHENYNNAPKKYYNNMLGFLADKIETIFSVSMNVGIFTLG